MSGLAQDAIESRVDVLFFNIGDQVYGADASSVVRIARAEWWALSPDELGRPEIGARALVFELAGGTGAGSRRIPSDADQSINPTGYVSSWFHST